MSPRGASFALIAAIAVGTIYYGLGPVLLAGFLSYAVMDAACALLARRVKPLAARWLALLFLMVLVAGIAALSARLLRQSLSTIPDLIVVALPKLTLLAQQYSLELPFDTAEELQQTLLGALRKNAGGLTHASGLLTKRFFHMIAGILIAVFLFMGRREQPAGASSYDAVRAEFIQRVRRFNASFERVVGAQVVISAVNTVFTAIFLLTVGMPHAEFLIPSTFVLGLLPVVGNILSNTAITCAALALSPRHAMLSLAFLIIIHKGEYFLNGRIVGASLRMPMWQTMLGILVGEIVLGVPGIVLAPALLHYARTELQSLPGT